MFQQTAEFSPPFFAPKKKKWSVEKKMDHTTSSGKGPFSGPLVCRLLSRPNRVPIHTSRAWCMMHATAAEATPPPHGGQSGPAPSGRQFSATTQLLGLWKSWWATLLIGILEMSRIAHCRLPTDPSINPPVQRRGGWEQTRRAVFSCLKKYGNAHRWTDPSPSALLTAMVSKRGW